eukprot:TRINITY_DN12878_c0_g2_i1.p1 TRINITY_DN12878_c0_g2~~TRINITY_DN12878_c0_g2_i1.p1  ORF type:complete len:307 (+),score=56.42 TRINITY_DN12878_c0_g2_i1:65-985(+)
MCIRDRSLLALSRGCYIPASELLETGAAIPSRVLSPTPAELHLAQGSTFIPYTDWRNLNGTDFTQPVGNQMLPSPCGSCWAFAATGALSDRIAIASGGLRFDISPQGLLDCDSKAGSCNGGSHVLAYAFAAQTGLTDVTCLPYAGMDNSNWGETACEDRMCKKCDRFGSCSFVPGNQTLAVRVKEHGNLTGVEAMKAEIASRGPIACLMYAHSDGFESYQGGIIRDRTRYPGVTHVVNVVGFGDAGDGTEYWVVKNSFGTGWGELGFYRVEIGSDIFNMESHECAWAVPESDFVHQLRARAARDID